MPFTDCRPHKGNIFSRNLSIKSFVAPFDMNIAAALPAFPGIRSRQNILFQLLNSFLVADNTASMILSMFTMQRDIGNEDELQGALTENRYLKDTIEAMRKQLEFCHFDKEDSIRRAAVAANADISQLQATIIELRKELQRVGREKEAEVQKTAATMTDEANQIKAIVAGMRREMEAMSFEFDKRLDTERAAHRAEIKQLHKTIQVLREELEVKHT